MIELEKIIQHTFKDKTLLERALTHTSHTGEHFQRMEFLGDRVLNLTLTMLLMQKGFKTEGQLAQAIAQLGSKETLTKIAQIWKLDKFILCHKKQALSIIPDACEAVIGAVFLDAHHDMSYMQQFIQKFWQKYLNKSDYQDPKSALQEWTYKHWQVMPIYDTHMESGQVHNPVFCSQVSALNHIAIGKGNTIKEAEKHAAQELLDKLK